MKLTKQVRLICKEVKLYPYTYKSTYSLQFKSRIRNIPEVRLEIKHAMQTFL